MKASNDTIRSKIGQLLDVPSMDPDDARRRKLLNILLAGVIPPTLALWLTILLIDVTDWHQEEIGSELYLAVLMWSIGIAIVLILNRRGPGWLASAFFLLLLTGVIAIGDEPHEVAEGRNLLTFAIPIIAASVLLRPYASFVEAGLSSAIVVALALHLGDLDLNPITPIVFFTIALVSWLAAHTMERAIRDLRTVNVELTQTQVELKDALSEACAEASKSQAILAGIADGVLVFDNDWQVTVANPAVAGFLDRPAEEVLGRGIEALMDEGGVAPDATAWKGIRAMIGTGQPAQFEWGDRTFSVSLSPVRDLSGEVTGNVAVLRDVTREVQVQRARESLFAVAAHELRTPLNAIINFANMLRAGVLPPEKQENAIGRIAVNGERLLILVNNLLERAKMEAGQAHLRVERFALVELIDGMRGVMDVLAQAKGLELGVHIADDVPATLAGDRARLHQVLVNLVSNGVKFTEEGSVRVRVYLPDAEHWALEVSDTGCGIPAEARSRIFEPFELAEDPVTRKHAGAGLGLSIVKQMVELMGGVVTVKGEVGQGSTFTVVLPLAPPQEKEGA